MIEDMTVRIVLADDHPVVRGGLRALIGTIDGLEVVGEAADGEAAVREVQLLRPDVVLMDVRMPGLGGVEAARRIREATPETAVLMLTMYDDDATVLTAMQAGARGYLLKGAEQTEIVGAIHAVVAGQVIFGPGIAGRVLDYFAAPPGSCRRAVPPAHRPESARSSTCSRQGDVPPPSPRPCSSHPRRSATTSPTSSPSSRSPTARKRSSGPARVG